MSLTGPGGLRLLSLSSFTSLSSYTSLLIFPTFTPRPVFRFFQRKLTAIEKMNSYTHNRTVKKRTLTWI